MHLFSTNEVESRVSLSLTFVNLTLQWWEWEPIYHIRAFLLYLCGCLCGKNRSAVILSLLNRYHCAYYEKEITCFIHSSGRTAAVSLKNWKRRALQDEDSIATMWPSRTFACLMALEYRQHFGIKPCESYRPDQKYSAFLGDKFLGAAGLLPQTVIQCSIIIQIISDVACNSDDSRGWIWYYGEQLSTIHSPSCNRYHHHHLRLVWVIKRQLYFTLRGSSSPRARDRDAKETSALLFLTMKCLTYMPGSRSNVLTGMGFTSQSRLLMMYQKEWKQ